VLVNKFAYTRFEPSGVTNNPEIRLAKSVLDYIFRWLALKFLPPEDRPQVLPAAPHTGDGDPAPNLAPPPSESPTAIEASERRVYQAQSDAPPCPFCGALMVRNGAGYKCLNCGSTSGCS
jgi:ribonucleoside-diphosphate reductase alpha chain